ncbi:MAG: hypothetical protein Q4D68_05650 [Moraxella equi]|nr:hypothetical protein [Moraxella equi]
MFDSFIGKQQNLSGLDTYQNGLKLADLWLERQKNAEMAKIQTQTQNIENSDDRFREMIGLAKQSKRSKWLLDDINAMQSAAAQAELANREKMADINKTMSETNKNNATATDTMAGVAKKRMDMTNPLYEVLAGSGSLDMGRSFLKHRHTMGAIDDEQYQKLSDELATLEGLTGDELKNWAWHIRKGDLPVDVLHQTANNRADNERALATNRLDNQTRLQTNALDNETSRLNNALDNETARQNNIDDNQLKMWQTEQEQAMRAGEVQEIMVGTDGNSYIVYKNGQVEPALTGVTLGKAGVQKSETQAQRMEREEKVLNFKHAEEQSNHGVQIVSNVRKLFEGLNKGDGLIDNSLFWGQSKIAGTDAYTMMKHLETLKANVFLSQVPQMKGMGALTEAEGMRLENAVANLNPYSKDFAQALNDIEKTFRDIAQRNRQKQAIYSNASNVGLATPNAPTTNTDTDYYENSAFFD